MPEKPFWSDRTTLRKNSWYHGARRPAPSIIGGCTTLSKGRFGHPDADRTISVREAALLQPFPHDYRLDTLYMDCVCNMIGNALPCVFAEAISRQWSSGWSRLPIDSRPHLQIK